MAKKSSKPQVSKSSRKAAPTTQKQEQEPRVAKKKATKKSTRKGK